MFCAPETTKLSAMKKRIFFRAWKPQEMPEITAFSGANENARKRGKLTGTLKMG